MKYNPWAVCTASVGRGKAVEQRKCGYLNGNKRGRCIRSLRARYERCVLKVKASQGQH